MRKILLEVTDELLAAIDHARGDESRNPAIENWLWNSRDIQKAAKAIGIKRTQRPMRGRPASDPTD